VRWPTCSGDSRMMLPEAMPEGRRATGSAACTSAAPPGAEQPPVRPRRLRMATAHNAREGRTFRPCRARVKPPQPFGGNAGAAWVAGQQRSGADRQSRAKSRSMKMKPLTTSVSPSSHRMSIAQPVPGLFRVAKVVCAPTSVAYAPMAALFKPAILTQSN
jgi:hypothetical protein